MDKLLSKGIIVTSVKMPV